MDHETRITRDWLNRLLRGELSAIATYGQALEKTIDHDLIKTLQAIRMEHEEAARVLRQRVLALGGEAVESGGIWGIWAQFVTGAAKLFGEASICRILREGEEHGLRDYELAIGVLPENAVTDLIRVQFIPKQKNHTVLLGKILHPAEALVTGRAS